MKQLVEAKSKYLEDNNITQYLMFYYLDEA